MIYTLTMNPSLDYLINLPIFKLGTVNRSSSEQIFAGGKGINVSIVLHNLGVPTVALGFIAGFSGEQIRTMLREYGVATDFITLQRGISRINIKLHSEVESEINAVGPSLLSTDIQNLMQKLARPTAEDILVLAGSIPASVEKTFYMTIMEYLKEKQTKIVIDATRELLTNTLPYKPFLIKPNIHELEEIMGNRLDTHEKIINAAQHLQTKGTQNVLVSMAADGAILLDEFGTVYYSPSPKGKKLNSVGAGDSMVAGFLYGYLQHHSYEEAFKYGVYTGSASAFSYELANKQQVEDLLANQPFMYT